MKKQTGTMVKGVLLCLATGFFLAGCNATVASGPYNTTTTSDKNPSAKGRVYYLPESRIFLDATKTTTTNRTLASRDVLCNGTTIKQVYIKEKAGTKYQGDTSLKTVADTNNYYLLSLEPVWSIESDFTIKSKSSGILESINASSSGQGPAITKNIATFGFTLAGMALKASTGSDFSVLPGVVEPVIQCSSTPVIHKKITMLDSAVTSCTLANYPSLFLNLAEQESLFLQHNSKACENWKASLTKASEIAATTKALNNERNAFANELDDTKRALLQANISALEDELESKEAEKLLSDTKYTKLKTEFESRNKLGKDIQTTTSQENFKLSQLPLTSEIQSVFVTPFKTKIDVCKAQAESAGADSPTTVDSEAAKDKAFDECWKVKKEELIAEACNNRKNAMRFLLNHGVIVAFDGIPDSIQGSGIEGSGMTTEKATCQNGNIPCIFYRQSLPLRMEVHGISGKKKEQKITMQKSDIVSVLHPNAPKYYISLKESSWADRNIGITYDENGIPTAIEFSTDAAAKNFTGALADALKAGRDEYVNTLEARTKIEEYKRTLALSGNTLARDQMLLQNELTLGGNTLARDQMLLQNELALGANNLTYEQLKLEKDIKALQKDLADPEPKNQMQLLEEEIALLKLQQEFSVLQAAGTTEADKVAAKKLELELIQLEYSIKEKQLAFEGL